MLTAKSGNGTDSNSKKTRQKKSPTKLKQHQQQMCHALRRYGGLNDVFASEKEMVDKADELRQMSVEELCKRFEIRRLRDFPAGTVMVYYGHKKLPSTFDNGASGASHVVSYQTEVNSKQQTGEVYMPERHAKTLEERPTGVVVYKGLKTNSNGVDFYDLEFITDQECAQLIANE